METVYGNRVQPEILDTHHHLWRYSRAEFEWMGDDPGEPGKNWLAEDLGELLNDCGISATIAVQARESIQENEFLVQQAVIEPRIKGIVAWVPFHNQEVCGYLETLVENPRIKGVRHILQAEPDIDSFIELDSFNKGLEAVCKFGLRFDLLVTAGQLPAAIRLLDRHPALPVVVDHIAKPRIEGAPDRAWCDNMTDLARRPKVWCKLSGMVTEVPGMKWTVEMLRPYFEVVLEAFGPERLMFGSDWPVCLWASSYHRWLETVRELISGLSPDEQKQILSRNGCQFYDVNL